MPPRHGPNINAASGTTSTTLDKLSLLESIATNLREHGYSVHANALPQLLSDSLLDQAIATPADEFRLASVGRRSSLSLETGIRNDRISWIDDSTAAGIAWIDWMADLQNYLNAHLYLGLFSFESHYALYKPGCFYKRHQDAFQGDANRILSVIVYLNRDWQECDAGDLILFTGKSSTDQQVVHPEFGTLVIFLSEEIQHEVLATTKDRRSIAGWFRANQSTGEIIDPPS